MKHVEYNHGLLFFLPTSFFLLLGVCDLFILYSSESTDGKVFSYMSF